MDIQINIKKEDYLALMPAIIENLEVSPPSRTVVLTKKQLEVVHKKAIFKEILETIYEKYHSKLWFTMSYQVLKFLGVGKQYYQIALKLNYSSARCKATVNHLNEVILKEIDLYLMGDLTLDSSLVDFCMKNVPISIKNGILRSVGKKNAANMTVKDFVDNYTYEDMEKIHNIGKYYYPILLKALKDLGADIKHSTTTKYEDKDRYIEEALCALRRLDKLNLCIRADLYRAMEIIREL